MVPTLGGMMLARQKAGLAGLLVELRPTPT